ncbi:MAG: glycosyltransferase family 1 protein [Candidatus Peribacteraceae bacterium]
MSKLYVDAREACVLQRTGKGQWARGFIEELLKRDIPVTLLTHTNIPREWYIPPERVLHLPFGWRWHVSALRVLRRVDISCALYVSPTSFIVPSFLPRNFPFIPIIHDLIAFRPEPHDWHARMIERLLLPRIVRRAQHICTASAHTRDDLLARYPFLEPTRVTPIFAGPMQKSPPLNTGDRNIVLCVGTLCPRKNQLRLIQAYSSLPETLRSQYQLVLVGGRGWHDTEILRAVKTTPGVQWKDYAGDDEYTELLTHCTLLALPSLYEGFGLQVLDALQRGVPLLTSQCGSLPEVTGSVTCAVDPYDVASIAQGLTALLTDAALRNRLQREGPEQAAQFSWKRTVDLFLSSVHDT